jgi:hypothetical protein
MKDKQFTQWLEDNEYKYYIDKSQGIEYWCNINGLFTTESLYNSYLIDSKQIKDTIVGSVIEQFKQRSEVGINKYGTTMDRNDLSTLEWMIHFREELMDGLLYLERVIQDNKKASSTSTWYDESLEQRINIIGQNGNEGTHYDTK